MLKNRLWKSCTIFTFLALITMVFPIHVVLADIDEVYLSLDPNKQDSKYNCAFQFVVTKQGKHKENLPIKVTYYDSKNADFNGWHEKGVIGAKEDFKYIDMSKRNINQEHIYSVALWGKYHFSQKFIKITFRFGCQEAEIYHYKDWAGSNCPLFLPNTDPVPKGFLDSNCWEI